MENNIIGGSNNIFANCSYSSSNFAIAIVVVLYSRTTTVVALIFILV
jgi:hypothetical protein